MDDTARTTAEEDMRYIRKLESALDKVRAEAREWSDAPTDQSAPCFSVGRLFLEIVNKEL